MLWAILGYKEKKNSCRCFGKNSCKILSLHTASIARLVSEQAFRWFHSLPIWAFQLSEAPDITQQRQAVRTVSCLNTWTTDTLSIIYSFLPLSLVIVTKQEVKVSRLWWKTLKFLDYLPLNIHWLLEDALFNSTQAGCTLAEKTNNWPSWLMGSQFSRGLTIWN